MGKGRRSGGCGFWESGRGLCSSGSHIGGMSSRGRGPALITGSAPGRPPSSTRWALPQTPPPHPTPPLRPELRPSPGGSLLKGRIFFFFSLLTPPPPAQPGSCFLSADIKEAGQRCQGCWGAASGKRWMGTGGIDDAALDRRLGRPRRRQGPLPSFLPGPGGSPLPPSQTWRCISNLHLHLHLHSFPLPRQRFTFPPRSPTLHVEPSSLTSTLSICSFSGLKAITAGGKVYFIWGLCVWI